MAEESRVRQTAYKAWIKDLLNGKYIIQDGWDPNYIETNGKKISRTNLLATVTEKYVNEDKTYATLILDDGSSSIQLRTFKDEIPLIEPINIGDTILVIGRPREQNQERFITVEIVKKVNPIWLKIRKLELPKLNTFTKPTIIEPIKEQSSIKKPETSLEIIEEEVKDEDSERVKVLETIERLEQTDKSTIEEVIQQSKVPEARKIILELLKDGEIFKLDGKLKIT